MLEFRLLLVSVFELAVLAVDPVGNDLAWAAGATLPLAVDAVHALSGLHFVYIGELADCVASVTHVRNGSINSLSSLQAQLIDATRVVRLRLRDVRGLETTLQMLLLLCGQQSHTKGSPDWRERFGHGLGINLLRRRRRVAPRKVHPVPPVLEVLLDLVDPLLKLLLALPALVHGSVSAELSAAMALCTTVVAFFLLHDLLLLLGEGSV